MSPNDIYTTLDEAKEEIKRRWEDKELKKKLEKFWGEYKPNFLFGDKPKLVLSKSLMTPNMEFKYFLDIAKEIDLDLSLFEYCNGKFVGKNKEKKHLGKMFFYHGLGKHNGYKVEHKNVVDFNKEEGKKIHQVCTICGKSFVDFHHELLEYHSPGYTKYIKDISEWFDETRHLDEYYVFYLSLFIKDHILFENFFFDSCEEGKFTLEKFLPSFSKVSEIFGVKPIIVPLLPLEFEKNTLWLAYDDKIKEYVDNILNQKNEK